jgi:2C-methyl-D-erythritol 2,4-cyclodiphosphate synthase
MAVPLLVGLTVAQGVMGIGSQVVGMVQQHQMAKKNEEMQKKMSEDMAKSQAQITAQFTASTGLGGNLQGATGQQQMGQGPYPPGMG